MHVKLADSSLAVGMVCFGVSFLRTVDSGGNVLEKFTFDTARELVRLNGCIGGAA